MKNNYRGCGIPTAVAVSILIWIFILISMSSCTSMEECEETVGMQYKYEVIYNNGTKRQFCNSYITLYSDNMTVFSYDYCDLHKRVKTERFRLKVGSYQLNKL